jgi:hypothetical protein
VTRIDFVVPVVGRRIQQALGIVQLVMFVSGADPEELLKPQDLGCPDFSQIEADALDLRQNI